MEAALLQAAGRAGQRQPHTHTAAERSGTERSSKEGTQADKEDGRTGRTNSPDNTERYRRDSVCQQHGNTEANFVFMYF